MLEGIQFVTNAAGEKTAVLIDLKQYGDLWEDFYDALITRQRAGEPRESLESVRQALKRQGKLNCSCASQESSVQAALLRIVG